MNIKELIVRFKDFKHQFFNEVSYAQRMKVRAWPKISNDPLYSRVTEKSSYFQ